jgi:hypothetical protein
VLVASFEVDRRKNRRSRGTEPEGLWFRIWLRTLKRLFEVRVELS